MFLLFWRVEEDSLEKLSVFRHAPVGKNSSPNCFFPKALGFLPPFRIFFCDIFYYKKIEDTQKKCTFYLAR